MRLIEQAVFTSIETGDSTGYHVVARSPGVCPSDARELCAWGPTHDSILDRWQTGMSAAPSGEPALPSGEVASFNFHPLPSGLYCISRTILAGADEERSDEREGTEERRGSTVGLKPALQPHGEGKGERGDGRAAGADVLLSPLSPLPSSLSAPPRADTHCLLVPPELLARFGNNPWAVIDAVWNRGLWQAQTLLERLAADPGPDAVAALVQAARGAVCLAIAGASDVASLIEGLFHCLPVECRPEFSFTTGLKFSPRRPFRMVAVPDDPAGRQWIASYPNVVVLDVAPKKGTGPISLNGPQAGTDAQRWSVQKLDLSPFPPLDGWSQLVRRALFCGQAGFLAAQVSRRRIRLTLGELPALGLQLLEELDRITAEETGTGPLSAQPPAGRSGKLDLSPFPPFERGKVREERRKRREGSRERRAKDGEHQSQRSFLSPFPPPPCPASRSAHAAHQRFAKDAQEKGDRSTFPERRGGCSAEIGPAPFSPSPETLDKLEQLDDFVYEAINGQHGAMERLEAAWPVLAAELDEELLTVSREQYLRYALSVWDQCMGADGLRQPTRAVAAVDVLCLLFGDAS